MLIIREHTVYRVVPPVRTTEAGRTLAILILLGVALTLAISGLLGGFGWH